MSSKRQSLFRLATLKSIIADVVSVPSGGEQPQGEQPAQEQKAYPNYSQENSSSLAGKMTGISQELGTANSKALVDYLTKCQVNNETAWKAVWDFAKKIAMEEKAKREQGIVNEVAQKLGINPADLSKKMQLPPLPGMTSSFRARLLRTVIASDREAMQKQAGIMEYVDKVKNLSAEQFVNLIKNNFAGPDGEVTKESIEAKIDSFLNSYGRKSQPVTSAVKSEPFFHASVGLICLGLWLLAEAVSPSSHDYSTLSKVIGSLSSIGAGVISANLWSIFKNKEEQVEKEKEAKKNRLYQGPQLG